MCDPYDSERSRTGQERMVTMNGLTEEYLLLFNAITDAEQSLARLQEALVYAQRQAEELYLRRTDPPAT